MKARPNERCPCGSGSKYKKCCGAPGVRGSVHTPGDRQNALEKLLEFFEGAMDPEMRRTLADEFFGDSLPGPDDDEEVLHTSLFAFQWWLLFDAIDDQGVAVAGLALEEPGFLAHGERVFVKAALGVRIRLYEVALAVPGESVLLRDMLDDSMVEVHERTASKSLKQWDILATRVFPVGSSGRPEMDGGVLVYPRSRREELLAMLRELIDDAAPEPYDEVARQNFAPYFVEAWRAPMAIPRLVNHDGHELCETRVFYDLPEPARVAKALDAVGALAREGRAERWTWLGSSPKQDDPLVLGTVVRKAKRLVLEANSRERAEQGRKLVEAALGDLATYRVTETSDIRSAIERNVASRKRHPAAVMPPPGIPPHLMASVGAQIEKMMREHYARWVDEPVPIFDGQTPREAASGPLRPRVVEALKDLENQYQRARAQGQPGFDPKELRAELGIEE